MLGESNDLIKEEKIVTHTKVYKRRWWILAVYILYALGNSCQWVEYNIITNVVAKFYNVTPMTVDWTAIIYLCIYPIIVLPVSYIIDTQGLRTTALIGGIVTALGAIVKVFSVRQDLFYVVMLGQAMGSTAQVFILCLPPKIAAVWFKPSEISLANSLGVFGTQLGFGLGFLVPSMIVKNSDDVNHIGTDLLKLCWILAIYMIPVAVTIIFYFPNQPPHPPSTTQMEFRKIKKPTFKQFCLNFVRIIKKPGMAVHMVAYGINIGGYTAFTTFLNQFVLQHFKDAEADAGRMGLLSVGAGMIGTILFGMFLDKTHKYKETNLLTVYMCAVSFFAMAAALKWQSMILTYMACISIGLFANSYWATGFEFAMEITFPSDESSAAGILNSMTQGLGCFITWGMGPFNEKFGGVWGMVALGVLLLTGGLLTQVIPNVKLRQEEFERRKKEDNLLLSVKT